MELRIEWEWSQVLKCPGKYLKIHLKFGEIKKKSSKSFYVEIFSQKCSNILCWDLKKIYRKNIFFEKGGGGGVIQPNWVSGVNEDLINISSSLHLLKFQNFQKSSMLRFCSKRLSVKCVLKNVQKNECYSYQMKWNEMKKYFYLTANTIEYTLS